ncbi:hypothetical protein L0Z64_12455 [Phaeobacter sp. BS23]
MFDAGHFLRAAIQCVDLVTGLHITGLNKPAIRFHHHMRQQTTSARPGPGTAGSGGGDSCREIQQKTNRLTVSKRCRVVQQHGVVLLSDVPDILSGVLLTPMCAAKLDGNGARIGPIGTTQGFLAVNPASFTELLPENTLDRRIC